MNTEQLLLLLPFHLLVIEPLRWSRLGVFNRILAELAAMVGTPDQVMIDATHQKAHRTAASLLKKGLFPDVSDAPRAA